MTRTNIVAVVQKLRDTRSELTANWFSGSGALKQSALNIGS
jgi:hypothetical protein